MGVGQLGVRFDAPTHLKAVQVGKHDVEQGQVRFPLLGQAQAVLARGGLDHLVASVSEQPGPDAQQQRVVDDEKDACVLFPFAHDNIIPYVLQAHNRHFRQFDKAEIGSLPTGCYAHCQSS